MILHYKKVIKIGEKTEKLQLRFLMMNVFVASG